MAERRMQLLVARVAQTPGDPFARYGLALELRNAGDLSAADTAFVALREHAPDYLPGYLMAAGVAVELGDRPRAVELLQAGLIVARRQGDSKTADELAAMLASIAPNTQATDSDDTDR